MLVGEGVKDHSSKIAIIYLQIHSQQKTLIPRHLCEILLTTTNDYYVQILRKIFRLKKMLNNPKKAYYIALKIEFQKSNTILVALEGSSTVHSKALLFVEFVRIY